MDEVSHKSIFVRNGVVVLRMELNSSLFCYFTYNVHMIKFEWHPTKSSANLRKHNVSFEEAQTVFYDENAVQFFDEEHSADENRFLLLGMSIEAKVLIVCHCERQDGEVIRIISARKATKRESVFYKGT